LEWLLFLQIVAVQASTSISVLRRRSRLEPVEYLRQLPFEELKFSDLLPDNAQLLGHEGMQPGPHDQTLPTVKLCHERFEIGEGEP
jgi:hypothetical protein